MLVHTKSLPSCLIPCNPFNCSLLGSPVHVILQARILEWVAMPSSKGPSPPRDGTHMSYVKNPKSGHWGSSDTQPQLISLSLWPPPPALDTVTGITYPADAQRHLASRKGGLVFRCLHTPNWAHRLDWHCWSTWRRKWKGWRKFVFGRFGTPLSGSQVGAGGSCQRRGQRKPKALSFLCNSSILAARPGCWLSS